MSVDKGDGKNVDGTSARKSTTSPGQLAGDDAGRGHGQVPHSPLFSEEQFEKLCCTARTSRMVVWPSIVSIVLSHPDFLDSDAARTTRAQQERGMEFLRMQAMRDQEEKEECRGQIQLLIEENFATSEEQPDKASPGFERLIDPHQRRADRPPSKEADRPPSKEADRPPFKEAARPPFLPEAAGFKTPKEHDEDL